LDFTIRPGIIDEILAIYPFIPELENPHGREEYERRLFGAPNYLLLIAEAHGKPIGFKTGYQREADGSFYSWMGGVAEPYRRHGIAQKLAQTMEVWATDQGYHTLRFTTRNRHKAMLIFALSNGYFITGVSPRERLDEYRIYLEKRLLQIS
jgi:GNAT superfamily N-acetyltransferase